MPTPLHQFTTNLLGHFPSRFPPGNVVHPSLSSASVSSELYKPGLKRSHFAPAKSIRIGPVLAGSALHGSALCNRVRQAVRGHLATISFLPSSRTELKRVPCQSQCSPAISINVARVGLFTSVSTNARLLASGIVPVSVAVVSSSRVLMSILRQRALRAPPVSKIMATELEDTSHLSSCPKEDIERGSLPPATETDTSRLDDTIQPTTDSADVVIVPHVPTEEQHSVVALNVDCADGAPDIERESLSPAIETDTPRFDDTIQYTTDSADIAIVPPVPTEEQHPVADLNVDACAGDAPDTDDATLGSTSPSNTQEDEEPIQVAVAPFTPISDSRPLTKSALRRLRRQRAEARAAAAEGREPRNDHVVRKSRRCQKQDAPPLAEVLGSPSTAQLPASTMEEELAISVTGTSDPTPPQDLPLDSTTKVSASSTTNWHSPIPPPKSVTAHDIEALAAQLSRLRCDDRPRARNVKQRR